MNFQNYFINTICVIFLSIIVTSCNIINPDESAPGYITIDTFTFDPLPTVGVTGPSNSTKIKDVWISIDNEFQGVYELPAKFPVLETGSRKVTVRPGIFLNGIASTRSPYPFYRPLIEQVDIPANGQVSLSPQTSYFSGVKCSFFEAFEGSGFSLANTNLSDTIMYQLPPGDPNIFEGSSSGVVYLDNTRSRFEVASTDYYELPGAGAGVFLELDYKINQDMQIGLYIDIPSTGVQQVQIYTAHATVGWNKVYVQLGYTVSAYDTDKFKIYFGAIKDPTVPNPVFYLDNIKIVHF